MITELILLILSFNFVITLCTLCYNKMYDITEKFGYSFKIMVFGIFILIGEEIKQRRLRYQNV